MKPTEPMTQTDEKTKLSSWKERNAREWVERDAEFTTLSGMEVPIVGVPDTDDSSYDHESLGLPGEYPYTRGPYPTMYRGRLWTMRQFSGFGTAFDTNERYKYLLRHGQTGLSVAFDMPTLMGLDGDHPRSLGEVGRCGVAVSSLEDMEVLFDGIPLDRVSTSMTINSPAPVLFALYLAVAEKQGVSFDQLRGTLQNDMFKEYQAQKEYMYPPKQSLRLVTDVVEYCARHVPRWHPISISGYHIREAGSTAAQELAFTLKNGFAYVEDAMDRGLDVDVFAPRLSFFFNSHSDFFEEIAKYRAARRIWARHLKEKYGAKDPRSMRLRFHTQTAGCSLTAQQPENNIVRTAFQAMAAVLGGTQSLHTNSMDETLALPTEKSVKIALRTQQVLAHETGVVNTIDPLGGSYFVEQLTDRMEEEAEQIFAEIDRLGGVIAGIESGYFQREIGRSSARYQKEFDDKRRIVVGVNDFLEGDDDPIDTLVIDQQKEDFQRKRLEDLRQRRDAQAVEGSLLALETAARGEENLIPAILDAVRSYATVGEIMERMKCVFGGYVEPPVF
jgi:methylmalonyl-CoA mutase N-terminal domain/subunit